MADIDTLRPEVRNAVDGLDLFCGDGDPDWDVARAELLRLAEDAAMFAHAVSLGQRYKQRAEHAEAELAALKARIAESPIGMVMGGAEGNQDNTDSYRVDVPIGWESSLADRRVRLVVED